MRKKSTSGTDWERVKAMKDEDIDYSDIPEQGDEFFAQAKLVLPEPKKSLTVRLDKHVLDWFRKQGPGYQTRINAVLRMYVESKQSGKARR